MLFVDYLLVTQNVDVIVQREMSLKIKQSGKNHIGTKTGMLDRKFHSYYNCTLLSHY